jgi:hypothetical protein
MTDIHDIKPALEIGGDVFLWIVAGLVVAALLLTALGIYLWRRRKRSKDEHLSIPTISPDQQAFVALDALAAEAGIEGKVFYFRLSAILRGYIEGRYHVPAAELTTAELIPGTDRLGWPRSMNREFREFCHSSDPIKFADRPAQRETMVNDLAFVRQLVDQTRRRESEIPDTSEPDASGTEPKEIQHQLRIGHAPATAPTKTEEA